MRLTLGFSDNLAVSAQGFRRGANRVRKVHATLSPFLSRPLTFPCFRHRICGELVFSLFI